MFSKLKQVAGNAYARAGVVTTLALAPVLALAQSTDPFDTAVTDMTAKITTSYGPKIVGLSALAVGFMVAIAWIRKIKSAAK